MAELGAGCLKTDRGLWPGRHHKAKFAGGGGDAMQAKKNTRLGSFNEKLEGSSLRSGASRKTATSLRVA